MLAYTNRLTEEEDFERVKKEGNLVQSESFAFAFLNSDDKNPPRFGFVVSTKISKKATLRNRAKRAMREAVRQSVYYVKNGIDGIFLAKQAILNKSTQEIMTEVKVALRTSGVEK